MDSPLKCLIVDQTNIVLASGKLVLQKSLANGPLKRLGYRLTDLGKRAGIEDDSEDRLLLTGRNEEAKSCNENSRPG